MPIASCRAITPTKVFPGKGINFLARCVSEAQLSERGEVSRKDVIRNFVDQTGMPELFLRDDLHLDQAELQQHFESARHRPGGCGGKN